MNNENDIILPVELSTYGLTLEEIGAVFVMFSMSRMSEEDRVKWIKTEDFNKAGEKIFERGILNVTHDDGKDAEITIDLTKDPKPFWYVYAIDPNGNNNYKHGYSNRDIRLRRIFKNNVLCWELYDNNGLYGLYDSMENATEAAKSKIKLIMDYSNE